MLDRRDGLVAAFLTIALVVLAIPILASAPVTAPAVLSTNPPIVDARPYVEGMVGRATNISPFGARSQADRDLVALVFAGLVRLGPGSSIVPDLAASWTVDASGAVWTFHLRPGIAWQDGVPLTAHDVAFTVHTLQDPTYGGPGAASWQGVTVTEVDPSTVRFKLATALGGFLQAATQPIAPAHLLEKIPAAELASASFGSAPVGSGLFQLVDLAPDRALLSPAGLPGGTAPPSLDPTVPTPSGTVLPSSSEPPTGSLATAEPTRPTAAVDPLLVGIEFRFYDSPAAAEAAFQAGDVDAVSGLEPIEAAALAATTDGRLIRYPSTNLLTVDLNLRPTQPAFRDPLVRRALLEAIDRPAIVAGALAGLGSIADGLIPPSSWAFDRTATAPAVYDPTAATAALLKAGWKRASGGWLPKATSRPIAIEIVSPDAGSNAVAFAVAEAVARDWRALGLAVTHKGLAPAELTGGRLRTGEFTAAAIQVNIGLDPDLYPLLASSQTTTGGSNIIGLQDRTLDGLLVAARKPGSEAARQAAYAALQKRLASQTYVLPIAFRDVVVVAHPTLVGPVPRLVGDESDRFWDVLTWRLADGQ